MKGKQRQLLRAGIQLFFFLAMPSAFVAGFSGVKYVFNQIGTGDVLEMNNFLAALIGLAIFTILFGRFFCGYVCAFGSLGDFVYFVSGLFQKKLLKKKRQFSLPLPWIFVLHSLKYIVLAILVIGCATGILGKISGWSPWDVFSILITGSFRFRGYIVGIVLLALLLIGMALQERFFCQFLCPMGALFSMLPILPPSTLDRDEQNCPPKCSLCKRKCPVSLKLEKDSLASGECIRCGRCAQLCPKENIHSLGGRLSGNEWWLVVGKALLFFCMGIACGLGRI